MGSNRAIQQLIG